MALDRYGKIWDSHRFSLEELPRFQDVLRECDHDALLRIMMESQVSAFVPKENTQARSMLEASIRLSVDALCSLGLDDAACSLVLIPKTSYVLNSRKLVLSRWVEALLIPVDGLPSIARYRAAVGGKVTTVSQADRSLRESARTLREEGRDCNPDGIPFSFHASEDLLSYRVWIPSGWCACERYLFLSSILWENLYSNVDSLVGFLSQQAMRACPEDGSCVGTCERPDQLYVTYRKKMADVTGALNHNAFLDCLDDQIELGSRLGLTA